MMTRAQQQMQQFRTRQRLALEDYHNRIRREPADQARRWNDNGCRTQAGTPYNSPLTKSLLRDQPTT